MQQVEESAKNKPHPIGFMKSDGGGCSCNSEILGFSAEKPMDQNFWRAKIAPHAISVSLSFKTTIRIHLARNVVGSERKYTVQL